jgi:hypothetical protein
MNFSPAYHLRTNKAVERLLFIELLRRLDRALPRPIAQYKYVGLGGPYLEDFNLLHATFGNSEMTSLELSNHVLTRQRLNRPNSCVSLTTNSTRQFTDSLKMLRTPFIVWFDYEWPRWDEQILECCDLIQKLPSMSLLKITLPASTRWLGGADNVERAEKLSEMFGDFGPFTAADLRRDRMPSTLYSILRQALADASPDSARRITRSLASYWYDDGTPILTVTAVLGPVPSVEAAVDAIRRWTFADINWRGPKRIAVPALSIREKLAVDSLLPKAHARTIINTTGLRFSDDYGESVATMANYVELYPHVPQFMKVVM